MGVIKKFNPETGQWEIFGSTEASDINIMDVNNNFSDKNVEAALRELSTKLNETMADVTAQKGAIVKHSSDIAWLKENGGGGGTGGGLGLTPVCFLVINKDRGMVVHPAPGHYSGTLVNALMYHCADSLSARHPALLSDWAYQGYPSPIRSASAN